MKNLARISRKVEKLWLVVVVASSCLLLSCGGSVTGAGSTDCTETFSWLPNSESNVVGYKIYYGQANGGPYPEMTEVGNPVPVEGRIQGNVTGLRCGQAHYFVSVAINGDDVESGYSTQVAATPDH